MFKKTAFWIIGVTVLFSSAAFAGSNSANLSPSASITSNCTIAVGTNISFGAYDPISGAVVSTTGALTIACTSDVVDPVITLGQGAHADTGSTEASPLRRLQSGSDYLAYGLYQDTGNTVWGNTSGTGVTFDNSDGDGLGHNVTVYAKIGADQHSAPAGSYSDTVVATITF
ncbi:MAG: spore coat U domain-containing protein [Bryobacteraceae bacterium]